VTNLRRGIYGTHSISSPRNIEIFSYANLSLLESIHSWFFFSINYSIKQITVIFTNQMDHTSQTNISNQGILKHLLKNKLAKNLIIILHWILFFSFPINLYDMCNHKK